MLELIINFTQYSVDTQRNPKRPFIHLSNTEQEYLVRAICPRSKFTKSRTQLSIKIKQILRLNYPNLEDFDDFHNTSLVKNTSAINLEGIMKIIKLTKTQRKKWEQLNQDNLQNLIIKKDISAIQMICKTLNFREKKLNRFLQLANVVEN